MKLLILSVAFGFAMFVATILIISPTDTFAREKGNSTQSFCMAAQSDHLIIGEEMTGALADLCGKV